MFNTMDMMKRYWLGTTNVLVFAIVLFGCRVAKPVVMPDVAPPAFYEAGQTDDSSSIGDLPWRTFFNDPYLVRLIDSALANNPDLHRAAQRISIAQNQYRIRNGALRPRVDGQLSIGVDKFGKYTMTGVGNFDTNLSGNINHKQRAPVPVTPDYFVGLQSSWEIDVWGKLRSLRRGAYLRYLASTEGARLLQTSIVSEVASRYFELLALDNEMKIINNNIRLQTAALEIVEIQKQAARANELAVQQFRAQLLHTRSLSGFTLQQITEVENELNMLQGRFPQPIARDTVFEFDYIQEKLQAGLPSQLLFRRPDIRQAEQELAASKADVAAARASFYPSLVLNPYLGFNSFKLPLLFNPASLVYGMLGNFMAPLVSQGVLKRSYAIADATRVDAYYAYKKVVQQGMAEVMNSISGLRNMNDVFKIKKEEVDVLTEGVATSNLLFKTGKASYLEVIAAQRNVIDAELQLVDTKRRMFLSLTGLYRSLGGGWK